MSDENPTPLGWQSLELRDVGQVVTGSTPPKARKEFYGGRFPFVKPGELLHCPIAEAEDNLSDEGAQVADIAPAGSVLVSCIGNLGKTGLATRSVAFNQQINVVIPRNPDESKWIFYAVQTTRFAEQLAAVSSATTIAIVNKGKFSALRIPVAPLPEQRRIVAEIEKQFTRLEAGVAALRRVQANLKRYRAAVLKAACEGQLVPTEAELRRSKNSYRGFESSGDFETGEQLLKRILVERRQHWEEFNRESKTGNRKYIDPVAPDTANLPPIPEGWSWATLDQLQIYLRNGWGLKPDAETGTPILRISANRPMSVNLEDVRFLSGSPNNYAEYLVTEGDLLFTRYNGNPSLTGVCGVVPPLDAKIVHPDKLIRVQVVPKLCQSKFVGIMANVGASRDFLASRARTTAGQTGISGSDLRGLPIPLPPLAEQTRIVAEVERRLSVVEELEAAVSANLQRAARLRHSILQKAFTGELFLGHE